MSVVQLTKDTFEPTIENNAIVLIDFWAPWCGPCRAFKPVFEAAAEQHPGVTFATCNTDEQQELAAAFGIRSIPTLMAFRDRVLIYAQPGMLPTDALEELIGTIEGLDMDTVRAEIAAQDRQEAPTAP